MDIATVRELGAFIIAFPALTGLVGKYLLDRWKKNEESIEEMKHKFQESELKLSKQIIDSAINEIKRDIDGIGESFRRHKSSMVSQMNEHSKEMTSLKTELRGAVKDLDRVVDKVFDLSTKSSSI